MAKRPSKPRPFSRSDYERVAGTSRNYRNKLTGQVLSRRQFDKLAYEAGEIQRMDYVRRANNMRYTNKYNSALASYVSEQRRKGNNITKKQARESQEFKGLYKASIGPQKTVADNEKKRRALIELGLRDGIPSWVPVGQSDAYRKGRFAYKDARRWRASASSGRAFRAK